MTQNLKRPSSLAWSLRKYWLQLRSTGLVNSRISSDTFPTMKSIISTYPGFQNLPRAIKQLLVTSESDFFTNAKPISPRSARPPQGVLRISAVTPPKAPASWRN